MRMSPDEFAITRHRLGLSLRETAHVLGTNERTVRRWTQHPPTRPGTAATRTLRDLLAERDERLATEVAQHLASGDRPVVLVRHPTAELLAAAGSPHRTVHAQDAYLSELMVLLAHEGVGTVIEPTGTEPAP